MKIHRDFHTINWSKGTSTELFIHPKSSSVKDRNFEFRISKASILEDSTFTKFEGYWRIFILLDGHIQLQHNGFRHSHIKPFQSDEFNGNWVTNSKGLGTAFNIITKDRARVKFEVITIDHELELNGSHSLNLIFVIDQAIQINGNEVLKDSLIEINHDTIHIKTLTSCKIICVQFEENN